MNPGQPDSPHKTFEAHSRAVLGDLLAGLSEADAALNHGLSERTIRRWLQIDEEELLLLVSRLGRRGNVRALALAREILAERRPPEPSPFDDLDAVTNWPRTTPRQ